MKVVSGRSNLWLCFFLILTVFSTAVYSGEPLKVFILAGQSNMEGHGEMAPVATQGTLEYLVANDPNTFGHIKNGANWVVRNDVWIWYLRLNRTVPKKGNLTAGYGASDTTIGPEFQFGNVMGDFYDAPVFILKCAWGGKSLYNDFRPPSSGWPTAPSAPGDTGYYYQLTVDTINAFKADPASFCDGYVPADGYEIVGFGWHQGWNDLGFYASEYEGHFTNFIEDIRSELGKPDLPFSISTTGLADATTYTSLELAQLEIENYTNHPDFELDVTVDDTTPYYRDSSVSPSNQSHHWNRNAESYYLVGTGMAYGMIDILVDPNAPKVDAGVDMLTWSGQPVILDPNVVEKPASIWTNLTYSWTATPSTGVTFNPSPNVKNPSVTITKSTSNPSSVVMKLEVNNAGRTGHGVIDTMFIDVCDNACKAAIVNGDSVAYPGDIDRNCIVDVSDFALMAEEWLNDGLLISPKKL